MVDTLTVVERSARMARIRGKDTKPELALRRGLVAAGLTGYRHHVGGLPGRPDVAYTRWKVAVFVDGAWWHGRPDRFRPERSSEFWKSKIERNIERDQQVTELLEELGWVVVRLWDDEITRDIQRSVGRVRQALRARGRPI